MQFSTASAPVLRKWIFWRITWRWGVLIFRQRHHSGIMGRDHHASAEVSAALAQRPLPWDGVASVNHSDTPRQNQCSDFLYIPNFCISARRT